jgi:hypothetical protein
VKRTLLVLSLALACTACQTPPPAQRLASEPRLQKLFETAKPVCFGRYLIDVPQETIVSAPKQDFGAGLKVIPNGAGSLEALARAKQAEVLSKSNPRRPAQIKALVQDPVTRGWTLSFWQSSAAQKVGLLDVMAYLPLGPHAVTYASAAAPSEGRTEALVLDQIATLARQMRPRAPDDIPAEPGVCLDVGFIADDSGKFQEDFTASFRFPSLPGLVFSVLSNKNGQSEKGSWLAQRRQTAIQVRGTSYEAAWDKMQVLREGRASAAGRQGEEVLLKTPLDEGGADLKFEFRAPGVRYDKDRPKLTIRMHNGEGKHAVDGMSDREVLLLWDVLMAGLRLRVAR